MQPVHPDPGFDLTGRRVLVTGASTGIGAAVAVRLAQAGASVVAVSRSGRIPDGDHGAGSIAPVSADLARADELDTVVDRSVELLGGIDVLVNNAGRGDWLALDDVDRAYFDDLMALNLWAPLRLSQLAHPHLAAGDRPVIVMVGSVDAVRPSAGGVVYGASKAGLAASTIALSKEWGGDGIRVVQVDPGIVDTPMASEVVPQLERAGFGVNIVRRAGRPDEIAGLVHYLVSPLGGFATGVSFRLDGGAVAMGPFDVMTRVIDPE
jgi:NAD(P)-dependent dehydrogenase (short-subunit alcohol dehydrogenase family)